ncbi:MAG: tRNA-intron lyase [Candidatus Bathyarchaeia archaeon]|nr:tRNA-intron lyase [Candidatus Bathyarchaeota archaeon]
MEKPKEIQGYLRKKEIVLPLTDEVKELREKGFGTLKNGELTLQSYEAFYLIEKGKIKVYDVNSNQPLSLGELVKKLFSDKKEELIKYLVYRDLREKGYIVRESEKMDFEVYGKGPLRRLVSIIHEGRETTIEKLISLLKFAEEERKELVLAVIDRRTDIVFYTLNFLNFKGKG